MASDGPEASQLHRNIQQAVDAWETKPSLRLVYGSFYDALKRRVPSKGKILEIGAGSGHSREFFAGLDVTRLDILPAPWIDIVADAHDLPLPDTSIDGIVMLDVLHHLADLPKFFSEVQRVLKPGGTCVMLDPGITPFSGVIYRAFHEEPVDMSVDPMEPQAGVEKDPFDSNQALPTLLFSRSAHREAFKRRFPTLEILEVRRMSLLAYPMTGGFQRWSLLSSRMAAALLKVETVAEPVLGRLIAFRLLVTIRKKSGEAEVGG